MQTNYRSGFLTLMLALVLTALPSGVVLADEPFTFVLTADMRLYSGPDYDSCEFYRGAGEAIAATGDDAFMIAPGDIDPTTAVRWTLDQTVGADFPWFPAVGNHELPGYGTEETLGANMDWLRAYNPDLNGPGLDPDIVNTGPEGCPTTTYAFDHGDAHFAVLNIYCDASGDTATNGDIPDHLYEWLDADLAATDKPYVFVVGHEPAYPQADVDSGRVRHVGDSLDAHPANRDRFWALLREHDIVAYFCGHTHNYSSVIIDDVWQIDVGHARGRGDTGAPSTFVRIAVDDRGVTYEAYRTMTHDACAYTRTEFGKLAQAPPQPTATATEIAPTATPPPPTATFTAQPPTATSTPLSTPTPAISQAELQRWTQLDSLMRLGVAALGLVMLGMVVLVGVIVVKSQIGR